MKLYALRCKKTGKWIHPGEPFNRQFDVPGFWSRMRDAVIKTKFIDPNQFHDRYVSTDFEVIEFDLSVNSGKVVK